MMKAAMMGAVAFQKGLGACHSLAHPLSSEKGMHHGLANALCLPAVVDFNETGRAHGALDRVRAILDPTAKTCGEARPRAPQARRAARRACAPKGVDRGRHPQARRQGDRRRLPPLQPDARSRGTISPPCTAPLSSESLSRESLPPSSAPEVVPAYCSISFCSGGLAPAAS